jgi:predicted O-methyltransferase YrrM
VNQQGQDTKYQKVKELMETNFPGRYELHRNYSVDVARDLLRRSSNQPIFDFIYLDARHDYEGIREDMEAWWPLLKVGGLFAGHDFVPDGVNKNGLFGVQRAVKEFVETNGKEVMSISEKDFHGGRRETKQRIDSTWTTWYFFK